MNRHTYIIKEYSFYDVVNTERLKVTMTEEWQKNSKTHFISNAFNKSKSSLQKKFQGVKIMAWICFKPYVWKPYLETTPLSKR